MTIIQEIRALIEETTQSWSMPIEVRQRIAKDANDKLDHLETAIDALGEGTVGETVQGVMIEPNKAVRETGAGRLIGYKLRTDRHGGCVYCAKPIAADDATCPHCGWDGEYPITKAPTPPLLDIGTNAHKFQGGVDLAKRPDYSVTNRFGDDPPKPARHLQFSSDVNEERMLKWFTYDHLPPNLQAASAPWCELAVLLCHTTKPGPERTVALRKLLEGKDAAVRATLQPGS